MVLRSKTRLTMTPTPNKAGEKKEKLLKLGMKPDSWLLHATQEEIDNCICAEWDGKGKSVCDFDCPVHTPPTPPTEMLTEMEKEFDRKFTVVVTYEKWPDEDEPQKLREPIYGFSDFPNTNPKVIKAFLRKWMDKAEKAGVEKGRKQVAGWFRWPFRKGMKPMTVPAGLDKNKPEGGLVHFKGCGICGGRLVMIRGKHPKEARRKVCPTCAVEIMESIYDNLTSLPAQSSITNNKSK